MEDPKINLKKMRVQLYDSIMNQIEDRLIQQDVELRKGPGRNHEGPMKLEFCVFERGDVEAIKTYLDQISGKIPLESKTPKTYKSRKASTQYDSDAESWRKEMVEKILDMERQDDMIAHLRESGFIFVTHDHLKDAGIFSFENLNAGLSNFQWMIKLLKEAKNPVNNKYDPTLLVGFLLLGEKAETGYIIHHGELTTFKKPWRSINKVTFKKTEMAKFPHYMTAEEREKFRIELYKHRKDPELKFSKFFRRWYKDVIFREKDEWAEKIENPN